MQKSSDETRVRKAMEESLAEWGVELGKDDKHARFYKRAIETAMLYCRDKKESPLLGRLSDLRTNDFPTNPEKAVEFVLRKEIQEDEVFRTAEDKLSHPFAPYYLTKDMFTGQIRYCRLKKIFIGRKACELDPFKRFSYRDSHTKEHMRNQWRGEDSLKGHVFEALVACQIIHAFPCESCSKRGGLRYIGGIDDACSWADIVCIRCRASYEIKSKRDSRAIERGFRFGFPGGSFRTFAGFEELGKRFLLVVSRKPDADVFGNYQHSVTIADIDHITPTLSSLSFDDGVDVIRLRSIIKAVNRRVLCQVPACITNFSNIAEEVFNSTFGAEEWSKMETRSRPREEHEKNEVTPHVRCEPEVQVLQRAILGLQIDKK